jgi:hypothetical protein
MIQTLFMIPVLMILGAFVGFVIVIWREGHKP